MLYREIIAVCSQIRKKHINTLCGQNVELSNVKNLVVYIVTTGLPVRIFCNSCNIIILTFLPNNCTTMFTVSHAFKTGTSTDSTKLM
jgi:hypothetical protein